MRGARLVSASLKATKSWWRCRKAEVAASGQALEETAEEHGDEDGLLEAAKNDKDKLTKAPVLESW